MNRISSLIALCLFACVGNLCVAQNPAVERLAALKPLPFPAHSWAFTTDLLANQPLLDLVVEITHSGSFDLRYVQPDHIRAILAADPEWLAVNLRPFHGKWDNYRWQKDDWRVSSGAPVIRYFGYLAKRLQWLAGLIPADQKIIFLMENENFWPNPVVDGLLNTVVNLARFQFPKAQFAWQVWGRRGSHVSTNVFSDYAAENLYWQAGSVLNRDRFDRMLAVAQEHGKWTIPGVSLGRCFDEWPFIPKGKVWRRRRSANVTALVQPGQTWALGRMLAREGVTAVRFWPPLFRTPEMVDAFAWFVMGANNTTWDNADGK